MLRAIAAEKKKEADAADANLLLLADAIQAWVPAKAGEFPSGFVVGRRLGSIKDSVHAGLRLVTGGERDGTTLWKVERVLADSSPGPCAADEDEVAPPGNEADFSGLLEMD